MNYEQTLDFRRELGRNIRATRKTAGLTQMQMVKHVSCNRPTWSKIENGDSAMRVEVFAEFCAALGADPSELLPSTAGALKGDDPLSLQSVARTNQRAIAALQQANNVLVRISGLALSDDPST